MSESFDVNFVRMHRYREGRLEFLIRWTGYSELDDTWEPESFLDCDQKIREYLAGRYNITQGKQKSGELSPQELRKCCPRLVYGAFKSEGEIYYNVLCSTGDTRYVKSRVLKKFNPYLIIDFLQNKVKCVK